LMLFVQLRIAELGQHLAATGSRPEPNRRPLRVCPPK